MTNDRQISIKDVPDINVGDTISRQAAIDTLNEYFVRIGKLKKRGLTKGEKAISLDTVGAIKTLPSVQAERPKGHWIDTGSGQECSECGEIQYGYDNFRYFCAKCGSDNREKQDG